MARRCSTCNKNTPECPYKHRAWSSDKGFYPSEFEASEEYCDEQENCMYHEEIQLTLDEIITGLGYDIHTFYPKTSRDFAVFTLAKKQAIEKLKELKKIQDEDSNEKHNI